MGLTANVTAGQIVQSTWGNEIRDRTAQRFTDAAQRAAQWPAPPKGALSVLDDWPGTLHVFDGTHWWGDQSGYLIATTSPSSTYTLTYPKAFTTGGVVTFWTQGEGTASLQVQAATFASQVTATQANLVFRTLQPPNTIGSVPSTAVGFYWWARGWTS